MKVQKVREKYKDTVERFCLRTRASKPSVLAWECGNSEPHGAMKTLLEYAGEYDLEIDPELDEDFKNLSDLERLKSVMQQYGDTPIRFAVRVGTSTCIVDRWLSGRNIGNMAKRLIEEMHLHPDRFTL